MEALAQWWAWTLDEIGFRGGYFYFYLILFKKFKLIFICQNILSNLEFTIIFIIFLNIHHIKTYKIYFEKEITS